MSRRRLTLGKLYQRLSADERVTPWHLSICLSLYMLWKNQGGTGRIFASRRELMRLTHIKSIVTYHKCIKDLTNFGIIRYLPSFDPSKGSEFGFVP